MYAQIGQQDMWFVSPTFASLGVWIVMRERVRHECRSWSRHTGVTHSPSKTITVSGLLTPLASSTIPWILQAQSADFGPVSTLDFLGLIQ